jgi:periplasmic divalent cation tolerance protein
MGSEQDVTLVYTVCATEDEARAIARTVVREGLAACANIWPLRSVYLWQGELVDEAETALLLKTVAARAEDVFARVGDLHSYELPCLLQFRPEAAEAGYAGWIRDGSRGVASEM